MFKQGPLTLGDTPFASPYDVVGKEECKNLYIEPSLSPDAKTKYVYVSVPGLRRYVESNSSQACRGLYRTGNERLFGVFGNQVIEILANGQRATRGSLTTYTGTVSMASNNYQLMIVDGTYGYILDFATNILTQIDPETFQNGATHVAYIDTYFLVNRPNSNQYNWSYPGNGLIWNPLDFATKEGSPDDIVAIKECNNQLWVFGGQSIEIHYNTGDTETQVWQRYQAAIIDIGCVAPYSVSRAADRIFWAAVDNIGEIGIFSNNNISPMKISTIGIEQIIQELGGDISKLIGYTYAQDGHTFYMMQFLGSDLTLAYDLTTGKWHQRTYLENSGGNSGKEYKWQGIYSAYCFNKNIFGDLNSNALYYTDMLYYKNDKASSTSVPNVSYINRVKTTPVQQSSQKRIRWNSLQIIFRQGVGASNTTDFTSRPVALLDCSNDSGYSWAQARLTAEIGRSGNTEQRTRFLNLGTARNRVYKIIITDPIPVILVGLIAEFEELRA